MERQREGQKRLAAAAALAASLVQDASMASAAAAAAVSLAADAPVLAQAAGLAAAEVSNTHALLHAWQAI